NVSIDNAEREAPDLRRELCPAERFSDEAIFLGSVCSNTPFLRCSASLSRVTRCDQRRFEPFRAADFRAGAFVAGVFLLPALRPAPDLRGTAL
ncbi:hypothetical protein OY671_011923, partial [Metschnikowia pulcherrima]